MPAAPTDLSTHSDDHSHGEQTAESEAADIARRRLEMAQNEQAQKMRELEKQIPEPKDLRTVFTDEYIFERRNLLAALMNEIGMRLL
jgi:hypothetical protein